MPAGIPLVWLGRQCRAATRELIPELIAVAAAADPPLPATPRLHVRLRDSSLLDSAPSADTLPCPRCGGRRVQRWGTFGERRRQRYRCATCRRTFSELTGTPMAYSKRPDRWVAALALLARPISVRAAARHLDVHPSTAFRWRHQWLRFIRSAPAATPLDGHVYVADLRIPRSRKGPPRCTTPPARHHGLPWRIVGLWHDHTCICVARDRKARTAVAHLDVMYPTTDALVEGFAGQLRQGALVATVGGAEFGRWCRRARLRYVHLPVVHRIPGAPARVPERYPPAFLDWRRGLRRWLSGFHGIATKNLLGYCWWFVVSDAAGRRRPANARRALRR